MLPGQTDASAKTILGQTQPFTGEQVVSLLARHPSTARFVTARLWSGLAYPVGPDDPVVAELAPSFAADLNTTNLARRIFLHPQFRSTQARQGLVKEPVEFVAGTLRALGIDTGYLELARPSLFQSLGLMNQVPFDPPSVGGWPQNGYWISTASSLARLRFVQSALVVAPVDWLNATPQAKRAEAIAARLGITQWTENTAAAISASAANPRAQLTLALVSPEHVLN